MDEASNLGSGMLGELGGRSDEEFEEFLASIGWSSSYGRAHSPARPEAPAKVTQTIPRSCEIETPVVVALPPRSYGAMLRLALAIVLVLCVLLRHPLESALTEGWAQVTGRSQEEALARDLLTQAHFLSLHPGTSAEEVRDRVGLPSSRGPGSALGAQQDWNYTTEPIGPKGRRHFYIVSMSEGRVVRTVDITELRSQSPLLNPQRGLPRYCGDVNALVEGGKPQALRKTAEAATVLVAPAGSALVPLDFPIPVLRTHRVISAQAGAAVEVPPVSLYWRGVLYALPMSKQGIPPSVLADDLKWLFQDLGCDGTGRSIAPLNLGLGGSQ